MPNKQTELKIKKILEAFYDAGYGFVFYGSYDTEYRDDINIISSILNFRNKSQFKKIAAGSAAGIDAKKTKRERCKFFDDKKCNCFLSGITHENKYCVKHGLFYQRGSNDYNIWRTSILERDNYQCKTCGEKKRLHVHHIKNYNDYPQLRGEISNGITLCVSCHMKLK